jgi:hypothetical protein
MEVGLAPIPAAGVCARVGTQVNIPAPINQQAANNK